MAPNILSDWCSVVFAIHTGLNRTNWHSGNEGELYDEDPGSKLSWNIDYSDSFHFRRTSQDFLTTALFQCLSSSP
jgi:hypothetical protein